jgi:3-hydroxyisobutyrate dehydrogenase-like beta-hydroxyacid dehydrogenase
MGAALVRLLLDAGYEVAVYNRTRSKADDLVQYGATIADRPVDLADRDVVFSMVSASADLEQVISGEGGLLTDPDRAPEVWIDSSTVSREISAQMRIAALKRGTELLAAPVSGNPRVVASGKLTLAVSGPREVFEKVEPLLRHLGRAVTYVGDNEVARLVKICHNVFLGVVQQSLVEITVLAEKGGVSRTDFLEFLNNSVMGSVFSRYKTPAMVNLDFTPSFTTALLLKDLDLGLAAASDLKAPMPVASATQQIVAQAVGAGFDQEDFAVLIREQARRAAYELVSEQADVTDGLEPADRR